MSNPRPSKPPVSLLTSMDHFAMDMINMARAKSGEGTPEVTISEKTAIFGNVARWIAIRFSDKISDDEAWEGQGMIDDLRDRLKGKDSERAKRERRVEAAVSRTGELSEFKRQFLPGNDGDDGGNIDGAIGQADPVVVNSRGVRIGVGSDS